MRRFPFVLAVVFALAALPLVALGAPTWVPGVVPDWDQPYTYAPPGPDPNPGPVTTTDPYDNWCSPTAAANLFGWWEDNSAITGLILTGLTDRQAFNGTPGYAGNAANPLWQQGLWHDGTVEIGWYMDTNSWRTVTGAGAWPNSGGGTQLGVIGSGAVNYAAGAWNDATTGLAKLSYSFTHRLYAQGGGVTPATAWADYIADIDAGMPLLVTFDCWVNVDSEEDIGDEVFKYAFSGSGMAHTVTGVGYIDPVPGVMDGGELFIVHDNWSTTQTNVAVPLWTVWNGNPDNSTPADWLQNDHFAIPEPGTVLLIAAGLLLLVRRKRR